MTCCEYFADCPAELIPALYSVGSRQKRQCCSKKVRNLLLNEYVCGKKYAADKRKKAVKAKTLLSGLLFSQEWPISGGNWGQGTQSYPEIIITGLVRDYSWLYKLMKIFAVSVKRNVYFFSLLYTRHADGSIKFWDASACEYFIINFFTLLLICLCAAHQIHITLNLHSSAKTGHEH